MSSLLGILSRTQPFTHTPLAATKDQIRLVSADWKPLASSSTIRLKISTYPRNACPEYDALSYVWGAEIPHHDILLNGKNFRIRENLYAFLKNALSTDRGGAIVDVRHDRSPYRPKYLWIDQLCIDQTSTPEKSQQVQRMAETYAHAKTVIAWLGAGTPSSNSAMEFMFRTVEFAMRRLRPTESYETRWDKYLVHNEHAFRNVRDLFNRPYWCRVWTVQEFLLPQPEQLIVACGERFMQWEDIFRLYNVSGWTWTTDDVARREKLYGAAMPLLKERSEGLWLDCDGRTITGEYRRKQSHHQMCVYIKSFANQKCFLPHDHIYGLLALCGLDNEVKVDYDKSPSAVYWDFMGILLRHNTNVGAYIHAGLAMTMGLTGRELETRDPRVQDMFKKLFNTEKSIEDVFTGKCHVW
ncbi:heterokaryon incompatibility protein-domain-containing protein [Clohesyomyces aquaticus]|uniref:Heterokaryon incompatibility protein-domain-containing protein n=1 Tax=Clohesyomyces aquaticus TaxID=1231657 RepID=A0A1Y1ZXF0_9PLEO|nr:heterokaryon incompatibility protein-domain-containing protein [Clohesyomyces aquaticus]